MNEDKGERLRESVDAICRADSCRVFTTLIRLLGDFDLAEERLHDAFRAALDDFGSSEAVERFRELDRTRAAGGAQTC